MAIPLSLNDNTSLNFQKAAPPLTASQSLTSLKGNPATTGLNQNPKLGIAQSVPAPVNSPYTALTPGQFNNTPLTTSTPPKPTSVVSSTGAAKTASNIKSNVIAPYDQAVNAGGLTQAQANERDAAATTDMKFLPGSGKPNPNYIDPNKGATTTQPPSANPIEDAQANEILHPGQTQLFNTRTGAQEWVDTTNGTPAGYTTQDPKTRGDVSDSIQDANGNTIDKLSDGTYRRTDINGNYTLGTAAMFSDAKRVQDVSSQLDELRKGIYTPAQQSQIDGLQSDYQDLIDKQTNINENLTGGTSIAMARAGLGNQIFGAQQIDKTVRDGISAVASLTRQRDDAIAKMKSSFETDDMNALKSAYDLYNTSSQQIQQQIDKTQAAVQAAKDKQDLKNTSNAITMGNKYLDTTDPILPSDDPQTVAEKVKTSPTWQAEQTQKAGQVDPQAVDGAYNIWLKTGALPTGFSAMSQNLKNAIYKKIGGNPDSVDQSVVNKATLAGASKALATQTNQLAGTKTSINTLDKTLTLAETYNNKVDRTGSPFLAKYANFLKGKVAGDADTAAFQALMKTAASEYAKIMNGSASSISGATVSSVADAESIINAELSKGQFEEVANILRKDAEFRVSSQKDTIAGLQQDIKSQGSMSTSSSGAGSSGGASSSYTNGGAF